ncbi:MAG: LacI family DNA-binding transcriptional regulator [Lachnospiraceae bacterium]
MKGWIIITIKEIAKLAGVSSATVSFVLHGRGGVADKTREKVTALLLQYGFTPKNLSDEELSPQGIVKFIRYRNTGDLVERNDDFITQVMEGIDYELRQFRYSMNVINVDDSDLDSILSRLEQENLSGIIFLGTEYDADRYPLLKKIKLPFVIVDNCFRNYPVNSVDMNNLEGIQNAIHYLYDLGHREIGYLQSNFPTGSLMERTRGVFYTMHELSLDLHSTIHLSPRIAYADKEMEQFLETKPLLPTAYIADNDVIAAGAMRALLRQGILIPDDLSVIGFDDSLIASIITPQLTTVRIRKREMGICAVRRLIELMQSSNNYNSKTSVDVELIKRDTVSWPRNKANIKQ